MTRSIAMFLMFVLGSFLALSVPAQEIAFAPLQRLTNNETVVTLAAPSNRSYTLTGSTNLMEWAGIVTAFCTNTSIQYTDSAAPFLPYRYYRAVQLADTNAVTGDHVPTDAGDIVIHKGYHASFAMSWSNIMIYVDPTNRFPELPRADLILLTHNHGDHFDTNALYHVRIPSTIIVSPQLVYSNATFAPFRAATTVMTNGMVTNLLGINIEAIPMYNANHPQGAGNGYLLTMGGKRIYISGDTGDTPEMRALRNIDVAFLPMNQYTLSVSQAVSAVRAFVPKIVYPEHYKNSNGSLTDIGNFKTQVLTNPGVEVRLRNWY